MSWNSRRNSKFTNIILVIICIALIVVLWRTVTDKPQGNEAGIRTSAETVREAGDRN